MIESIPRPLGEDFVGDHEAGNDQYRPANIYVPRKYRGRAGYSPISALNATQLAEASTRCMLDAERDVRRGTRAQRPARKAEFFRKAKQRLALGHLCARLADYLDKRSRKRGETVLGSDLSPRDVRRAWADSLVAMEQEGGGAL